uniref:Uncharacterized protein n=1 Tax=Knipowitschia caucasica TaxID=637954 RepID=A0AAV2K6N9_KNICA
MFALHRLNTDNELICQNAQQPQTYASQTGPFLCVLLSLLWSRGELCVCNLLGRDIVVTDTAALGQPQGTDVKVPRGESTDSCSLTLYRHF